MKRGLTILALLCCAARECRPQDDGDIPFDARSNPDFGDPPPARAGHYCVVGYQSADHAEKRAWIHWREGRQISLWRGGLSPSTRVIDLRKHVVRSEAEVKGSNYLVTRAWADRVLADCAARGAKYQIKGK